MRHARRAFDSPDPGWLYLIAGLAMFAALILIPAGRDVQQLRGQLRRLHEEHAGISERLAAHSSFLDALDRADPDLVRRLAASQLNQAPENAIPLLLAANRSASVTAWIESSLAGRTLPEDATPRRSRLARLADGPYRLWLLGGSILSVFIGLVIGARTEAVAGACDGRENEAADDDSGRLGEPGAVSVHTSSAAFACGSATQRPIVAESDEDEVRVVPDPQLSLTADPCRDDIAVEADASDVGAEVDGADHEAAPAREPESRLAEDVAGEAGDQDVLPFMSDTPGPADAEEKEESEPAVEVNTRTPESDAVDSAGDDERATEISAARMPDGAACDDIGGDIEIDLDINADEVDEDDEAEVDPDAAADELDEDEEEWEYEYVYVDEDGNEVDPDDVDDDDAYDYEYEYVDADEEPDGMDDLGEEH
jgi:hypothetical protein